VVVLVLAAARGYRLQAWWGRRRNKVNPYPQVCNKQLSCTITLNARSTRSIEHLLGRGNNRENPGACLRPFSLRLPNLASSYACLFFKSSAPLSCSVDRQLLLRTQLIGAFRFPFHRSPDATGMHSANRWVNPWVVRDPWSCSNPLKVAGKRRDRRRPPRSHPSI
jgi:hypothetical protein